MYQIGPTNREKIVTEVNVDLKYQCGQKYPKVPTNRAKIAQSPRPRECTPAEKSHLLDVNTSCDE